MKKSIFSFLALLIVPATLQAFAQVRYDFKNEVARINWDSEKEIAGLLRKTKGYKNSMVLMKQAYRNEDFKKCAEQGAKVSRRGLMVAPWVMALEIECLILSIEKRKLPLSKLVGTLDFLNKKKDWFLVGPYAEDLRSRWVTAYLLALRTYLKLNPKRAQAYLNKVFVHRSWLDEEKEAELYKYAGELAFAQQRFNAAKGYIKRSLLLKNDSELQRKLEAIETRLLKSKSGKKNQSTVVAINEDLEASEAEIALVKQISSALEGGDLINGLEYALDLMEKFPGGLRAQWASERVLSVYSRVLSKEDKNYELMRKRIEELVEKGAPVHLIEWGRKLYWDGHYKESYELGRRAYNDLDGHVLTAQELASIARSSYAVGKWSEARKQFTQLFSKFAGTEESREALYRLGLIAVRKNDLSVARGYFERLLAIPNAEEYELRTRYWLWRSIQKQNKERAEVEAKTIYEKFPLSYYGLRARAELNKGVIDKLGESSLTREDLKVRFDLTEPERTALNRLNLLLSVGWHEEAQKEIENLPVAATPELKILMARQWAAAGNDLNAIILVNKIWDDIPSLVDAPVVRLAYPTNVMSLVKSEAESRGVDPTVVMSLIRQESAFNKKAVSRSGAMGLMQLIPPTAQEVAGELKVKGLKLPDDMFKPRENIRFGTYYLHKMMGEFDGHLPLSFAAYNAGPHRLKKWMESRNVKPKKTIDPIEELWIEELPWAETRFYVKAILRNMLIYRFLDGGPVGVTDPFWQLAKSVEKKE